MIADSRSKPVSQATRLAWAIAVVVLLFCLALLLRILRDGDAA